MIEVELAGVPEALDGIRIAHLSDLHLGVRSRGQRAAEGAIAWVSERRPELVLITGDLVSRRAGLPMLRRLMEALPACIVVLGNHDLADSRDPFSEPIDAAELEAMPEVTLLSDNAVVVELRGLQVQVAGIDPRTYALRRANPQALVDRDAELRVLLSHFPGIARRLPPGAFHLVLAGHFHAGQIVVPFPRWKVRLAHLRASDVEGIYRYGRTVLHVSPGIGTTFVPFRFFARPEVTELVVRSTSMEER